MQKTISKFDTNKLRKKSNNVKTNKMLTTISINTHIIFFVFGFCICFLLGDIYFHTVSYCLMSVITWCIVPFLQTNKKAPRPSESNSEDESA